jgi:5-oxoprolinase (ATP-hydrolysing)
LTITDIHVLLGRIDPGMFGIPLDVQAAESALNRLMDDISAAGHPVPDRHSLCEGLLVLANDTMADAIRGVTLLQGIALNGHALVAFGGAGGLHGAQLAERLGLDTVVIPPDAGLLSARGLAGTGLARTLEQLVAAPLAETDLWKRAATQEAAARAGLIEDGYDSNAETLTTHTAYCHVAGQEAVFPIALMSGVQLVDTFADIYAQTFGAPPPAERAIVCDTLVTTVREVGGIQIVDGDSLQPCPSGTEGPISITLPHSAFFVPAGWKVSYAESGAIVLHRCAKQSTEATTDAAVEAALWSRRFATIADAMGDTLQRTALSVNVRDRLDYSCAVLDTAGRLVATAAHIPVHLGALGACVRALIKANAFATSNEVVVNHPAFGGSHLPDVTLVTRVLTNAGLLCGYVASRAHHAELGGSRPGSMPPRATTLVEEGVVIPPMPYDPDAIRLVLSTGPFPSRAVSDNLADLAAQRAANREGALQLAALVESYGMMIVDAQQQQLATRACVAARRALARIRPVGGKLHGISVLEHASGPQSYVLVTLRWPENPNDPDARVEIDFTGTSGQVNGNLNAPLAVTQAAVLYVLRLLVADDIPLSDGILDAIKLVVPSGTFINPVFSADPAACPAVVGGNTEVSQRIVDALLDAIGICASSQGTMNNILFGNTRFSVYETLAGGSGAAPGHRGADGVHVHMTNTRITDPEVLERRVPVRLMQFRLIPRSGGKGKWRGGCGVRREWEFLEDVQVSVITQSRNFAPRGRAGGGPG